MKVVFLHLIHCLVALILVFHLLGTISRVPDISAKIYILEDRFGNSGSLMGNCSRFSNFEIPALRDNACPACDARFHDDTARVRSPAWVKFRSFVRSLVCPSVRASVARLS